jgi:bromodomain-containing protein 7/9
MLASLDTHKIFYEPVTDEIAPGYSAVITNPMCFLTMKQKEKSGEYTNLDQICILRF